MDRRLNLGLIEGVILMFTNLSLKYESENPWDLITYYLYTQLDMNFSMLILLKILELAWL